MLFFTKIEIIVWNRKVKLSELIVMVQNYNYNLCNKSYGYVLSGLLPFRLMKRSHKLPTNTDERKERRKGLSSSMADNKETDARYSALC